MPDFFDKVLSDAAPTGPTAPSVPSAPSGGGDFFDRVNSGSAGSPPSPIPGATPLAAEDEPTWWDQNGRTIEAAAAGGLALLAGPRLARGANKLLGSSGVLGQTVKQGGKNVQAIMAPSTVDESAGRAAATTRAESGLAARESAQAQAALEPFWQKIGGAGPNSQRQFIQYVEGRSKGMQIADPELQPLADEMKYLYDEVHKDMGQLNKSQKAGFIEDYYRHQWVRDEASERIFAKEGSSSFTKKRSVPTIEDGLAMGLVPRTLDPVQTTLEYVTNARRFIAANKILNEGERTGDVIFRPLGAKTKFPTGDNWVPIEGSLAKKGGGQLYAKEGWARVYNNWRSPGFTGAAGDVVQTLRRTSNTITGLELGLSGFHFTTMVNEAIINDVAKAITDAAGGNFGKALMGIVKSPSAPYRLAKEGHQLEKVYLGKASGSPEMKEMADLLTAAGGRAKGSSHAQDYEYTAMGNFWDAWKTKGSLGSEFKKYGEDIKANPLKGMATTTASLIGRTMQTVMKPLFEHYIPKLKNGAFMDTMEQWMRVNPTATRAEKEAQARIIWDSIDNRFGESVNDNIFWKQHMKQLAMLSMRSYSWNMGTIREIGGGVKDIASHELTPRAAYVIALPLVYGTIGALYQIMKTGEKPQTMDDLIAPRTGGIDPATGMPERMVMPGYMKDVFGWYKDPLELAKHKLSTFITTVGEMATGTDWRGAPIAPPSEPGAPFEDTVPPWLEAYFKHVGSKLVPISVRDLSRGEKEGSNITIGERLLGMQPGGRKYIDREGLKAYERYKKLKGWSKKEAFDARQESYYGGVE